MTNGERVERQLNSIRRHRQAIKDAVERLDAMFAGKKATVLTNYNGQHFGHSKPSLKGKTVTIYKVMEVSGSVWLDLLAHDAPIRISDVRIHWEGK